MSDVAKALGISKTRAWEALKFVEAELVKPDSGELLILARWFPEEFEISPTGTVLGRRKDL